MSSITAEEEVITELRRDVTPVAEKAYKSEDEVLVCPENEKEWIGPYDVVNTTRGTDRIQSA